MRSQSEPNVKHILTSLMEGEDVIGFSFIEKIIPMIKKRLNSPESAAVLKDLFLKQYVKPNPRNPIEKQFGNILYREECSYKLHRTCFLSYRDLMVEYIGFDIKRLFGLSITDYLDLTRSAQYDLLEVSKEIIDSEKEQLNNKKSATMTQIANDLEELE